MRRADRLFRLVQELRCRKLARAMDLAEALEVSERTIYRDIRDLAASGIPIEGEAGVGYVLRGGFHLPPLMFDEAEIQALVLGARMVARWGDPELADAAGHLLSKVEAVLPERLRPKVEGTRLWAPGSFSEPAVDIDSSALRKATHTRHKVRFAYRDEKNAESQRTVRPLGLAFFGPTWLLISWCELRQNFRAFRLDRMRELEILEARFAEERGKSLHDYLAQQKCQTEVQARKTRQTRRTRRTGESDPILEHDRDREPTRDASLDTCLDTGAPRRAPTQRSTAASPSAKQVTYRSPAF